MAKHIITPAWQTSRGPIVQAHGCAAGVPVAGAKVFGETRQNLWVDPSTATQNGVTLTSNDDGSIKLSGTATAAAHFYIGSCILKPGTQYCFSGSGFQEGSSAYIQNANEANFVGIGNKSKTFTTKSAFGDAVVFGIQVAEGTTVNATVRTMLNEGPTAQPWCPPGLSGVDEPSIVTAGKNLAAKSSFDGTNQIDCHVEAGMPITVSFDAQAAKNYQLFFHDEQGVFSGLNVISITADAPGRVSQTITLTYDSADVRSFIENGKDEIANLMVEYGSSATAYESPSVTTTPIDLSGHQLRSLPDGTRDVLTVDGSGAVSVEQAVEHVTIDGTNVKAAYKNNFQFSLNELYKSIPVSDAGVAEIFCDSLPVASAASIWNGSSIGIGVNSSGTIAFAPPGNLSTIEDANTWLAQHPVTVVYPAATPQTIALGPISPPTVPADDAALWAASDVPCELEATTWTASGAEQGRQQAAMVKVAQQVRQQAETVAALAAKALEA